jgi:hypothetical protein
MHKNLIMKQVFFLSVFVLFSISIQAQSVKAKLGAGGSFDVLDDGVGVDELVKLRILETGEVRWFLDGQQMFIRESNFEYETGKFGTYDHFYVDGVNGRLGINVLSNTPGGADDNLPLTSSVNLFGSIATRVRLLDGGNNYLIKQDDHTLIIDMSVSSGDATLLLPAVADSKGRQLVFKRNGAKDNKVDITAQGLDQLNGSAGGGVTLNNDNAATTIVCDENGWWTLTELGAQTDRLKINSSPTDALNDEEVVEVNFTSVNQIIDVKLPSAADFQDKRYVIKRNANSTLFTGNVLRIIPQLSGSEKLDFYTNANPFEMLSDFEAITVESNGTQWLIVSDYKPDYAGVTVYTSTAAANAVTHALTLYEETVLCEATNDGEVILILPATAEIGKKYTIKRQGDVNVGGTNNITVLPPNNTTIIDNVGLAGYQLGSDWEFITIMYTKANNWSVIAKGSGAL